MVMLLFYFSLRYISLVDGTLLVMTNALFIPILTFIWLGVKTSIKGWVGVLLGFVGVVLVLKPGHELFHLASILALIAGFCASLSIFLLRELTRYDGHYTIMFYYFPLAFLISGLISIFNWKTPDLHTIILLLFIGIFGTAYQEFLIRASENIPAKIVSSLLYLGVIFSGLFGWLIWGEVPHLLSWIGVFLVCFGSIMTVVFVDK